MLYSSDAQKTMKCYRNVVGSEGGISGDSELNDDEQESSEMVSLIFDYSS